MYDHVHGQVVELSPLRAVVRASGVGYELKIPMSTSAQLEVGTTNQLFTLLHVVEGHPTLLGFASRPERELARQLLSVSGVGPAMTLNILSTFAPGEVVGVVVEGDVAAFKRVKGVGAKTAERLCLELRDRVGRLDLDAVPRAAPAPRAPAAQDAVAALITLGYPEKEAGSRVDKTLAARPDASTEDLIKAVLRG